MSNLLNRAIPVAIIALTLLACTRPPETDEERIWTVVNDENHPEAISIAAQKIDLRGLRAFRVIRPAADESFGILSCAQHGYLLAFRNGRLSGVRRVDALRDVRLPDPDVASSDSAPSVIAKHPNVLFTTEGATVGTDGYLLTYHMYEISRTKTGITFSERWSDVAVDMETRAGFAQTVRFGTLNLAIPPAGDRSFYYVQTDLLAAKVFAKQCIESTNKRIDCKPWDLGRDASPGNAVRRRVESGIEGVGRYLRVSHQQRQHLPGRSPGHINRRRRKPGPDRPATSVGVGTVT